MPRGDVGDMGEEAETLSDFFIKINFIPLSSRPEPLRSIFVFCSLHLSPIPRLSVVQLPIQLTQPRSQRISHLNQEDMNSSQ